MPRYWRVTTLVGILLAFSRVVLPQAGTQGLWTQIPNLPSPQAFQTATLLPDSTIVEAGGLTGTDPDFHKDSTATASWYLPSQNGWVPLPSMAQDRYFHAAAPTTGNKMIVAGGYTSMTILRVVEGNTCGPQPDSQAIFSNTVETFDEDSLSWSMAAPMNDRRAEFSMVRLFNGLVLAAAGGGNTAELYNPSTNTWTRTRNMNANRLGAATTLLSDGRVFVAGGDFGFDEFFPVFCGAEAEVYDPASDTWTNTNGMAVNHYHGTASLIRLPDGSRRVLVAGGISGNDSNFPVVSTAELWDPTTNNFTSAGNMLVPRAYHAATVRDDGSVLITGGINEIGDTESRAEVYDPSSNTWSLAAPMIFPHMGHTAVKLGVSGRILIAGGANWTHPTVFQPNVTQTFFPTATAEIYHQTPISTTTLVETTPLPSSNAISSCQPGAVGAFVGSNVGLGTPTGSVSFFDLGAFLLSPPLNNGIATLPVDLAPGTHQISAHYSGDSNFSPSTSSIVSVQAISPQIVVTGPATAAAGTQVMLSASVPVGAVAPYSFIWTLPNGMNVLGNPISVMPPLGQDTYTVNGSDSNGCSLNPATFTVNALPAGVNLLIQMVALTRDSQGNLDATFRVTNQGADTAASLQLTNSTLNGVQTSYASLLPIGLGSLAGGAQAQFTLVYPGSAAAAGATVALTASFTFVDSVTGNGGNVSSSFRVTAP